MYCPMLVRFFSLTSTISILQKLPVNELPDIDSNAATSTVELADGWMDPAQLHCQMNSNLPEVYSKAKTLMASDSRIDDDRMIKVRLRDPSDRDSIEASTYSVADRESLMGFPIGYVQGIGKLLICSIHILVS